LEVEDEEAEVVAGEVVEDPVVEEEQVRQFKAVVAGTPTHQVRVAVRVIRHDSCMLIL
jgi:hypothetical protein